MTKMREVKSGLGEFLNGKSWKADGRCADFPEQLELFDKIFSENKFQTVLEVGFNAGHSAEYFLTHGTEFDVYSFDLGEYSACPLGKEYIDKTFPGRHHLILGDSRETIPEFVRNTELKFDFIFIDGGHQYNVAKPDIWNCRNLAHEETILVMDDIRYDRSWQRKHTRTATRAWTEAIAQGTVVEEGNDFGVNHRNKPTRGFAWGKYIFNQTRKHEKEIEIESTKNDPAITEKKINVVSNITNDFGNLDCDTLVCINSCEKHKDHLQQLKNSEFYQKLRETAGVGILEFYRGSDETKFVDGQLHLCGDERYDKLHMKTYEMIQWCVQNLRFNRLVKLDCNFLTYTHVGERTRKKICGLDRVERTIYKRKFMSYVGSNGREFLTRDFKAWSKQKGIETLLDIPYWLKDGIWYYCGKCYRINFDFAKFIATSEICRTIVQQHDVKNATGYHPFAVEDVMIGRIHEKYLETTE